jgi:hypothetical protein
VTILSGWREQYDRLLRSRDRLSAVATGRKHASSDEARDVLIHFFQDGWHLKDWLANDPAASVDRPAVEAYVNKTPALMLCADIANGTETLRAGPQPSAAHRGPGHGGHEPGRHREASTCGLANPAATCASRVADHLARPAVRRAHAGR